MTIALVLGGAATVWDDADRALSLGEFDGVVTCNDITVAWPGPITAAVSLHAEQWGLWIERRDRLGHPRPAQVFGHTTARDSILRLPPCITDWTGFRFPGQVESGSSGLFALKVALLDLGFDKAVLCGVPMTSVGAHFFDARQWDGAKSHKQGWREALSQIESRARSMSGWTRDILGEPTAHWIAS